MRLKLKVTAGHISKSWKEHKDDNWPDGSYCPIALALKDHLNTTIIDVDGHQLSLPSGNYVPTEEMKFFIKAFDQAVIQRDKTLLPKPFSIEEELVEGLI